MAIFLLANYCGADEQNVIDLVLAPRTLGAPRHDIRGAVVQPGQKVESEVRNARKGAVKAEE